MFFVQNRSGKHKTHEFVCGSVFFVMKLNVWSKYCFAPTPATTATTAATARPPSDHLNRDHRDHRDNRDHPATT